MLQPLTREAAESLGLADTSGAIVAQVLDGSPAQKAGLAAGDIVRKLDGERVLSSKVLRDRVADAAPGTRVELVVLRSGKERSIAIELGRRAADAEAQPDPEGGLH